jgi:cell division protein ZapA (FtsZ GTPase activity inhibitor)
MMADMDLIECLNPSTKQLKSGRVLVVLAAMGLHEMQAQAASRRAVHCEAHVMPATYHDGQEN